MPYFLVQLSKDMLMLLECVKSDKKILQEEYPLKSVNGEKHPKLESHSEGDIQALKGA